MPPNQGGDTCRSNSPGSILPSHLVRKWTNGTHSNAAGRGVRGSQGEGETRLELDRRRIQDRIALLKKRLLNVVNNPGGATLLPLALIDRSDRGLNSGKSTLLNTLTEAGVLAEDKLFATLDPTTRLFKLPGGEVLLSDTVGFISDLPHHLVDAFKSTLRGSPVCGFHDHRL